MKLPSKTTGFSLLFTLVFIISLDLMFKTNEAMPVKIDQNTPDIYSKNIEYINYAMNGLIENKLTSQLAVHYPKSDTTDFNHPKLNYYTENQQSWIVTSDKGKSLHGKEKILLNQNVLIHQPQTTVVPDTKIYTQHLTIDPSTNTAKTNDPVKITRPGTVIHGIGMTANLKTGEYKLLKQARGTYYVADA